MLINKSVQCKTLKETLELVKKLEQKKDVKNFNFVRSRNVGDKKKHFTVNWIEEGDVYKG